MSNRWLILGIISLLCLMVSVCLLIAWPFYRQHQIDNRVARLVSGATDVHVLALRIEGQQREVVCSRNDLVQYFEDSLRQAECPTDLMAGGLSYSLELTLDCGGTAHIQIYVAEDGILISIPRWAVESGFATHRVRF